MNNPTYAVVPSIGWGVNGNENSVGIQANRFKDYLSQNSTSEIVVAVVDNGLEINHPKFEGRLVNGWGCDEGDITPSNEHGTHVAGIIVDCTPSNVKIMPVNVYSASGGFYSLSSMKDGIIAAVDAGAKVINFSQGWDDGYANGLYDEDELNRLTEEGIQYAKDHDVVVVVSAGNSSCNTNVFFPPKLNENQYSSDSTSDDVFENLITVSAVDENDLPWCNTNYGNSVDVCAPGVDIVSSVTISTATNSPDMRDGIADGYGPMSGTSMAAPHVSAAVAMLALEYPEDTAAELKERIKSMTVDLGEPGWDSVFGTGRIDFRMLNHPALPSVEPVLATSFEQRHIASEQISDIGLVELYLNSYNNLSTTEIISAVVLPKDATDKSVTFAIANESIAQYENGRIKGLGVGVTTLTVTKENLGNQTSIIHVDSESIVERGASILTLGSTITNNISSSEAGDWFVFAPTTSGNYVFYSTGNTNVDGELYDSSGILLLQNVNMSSTNTNFAIPISLTAGNTYYLLVKGHDETTTGNYGVYVFQNNNSLNFTNKNQDARCVTFQATTLDLADTLRIRWGTTTYTLTKPTSSATVITDSAGRFRADLVYNTTNHTITWNIKLNVTPNTIGSTSRVVVTVLAGNVTLASNLQASSVIAYGSSYKTGLAPNTYVSALLSSMATTGYTFTAYDWNDTQITATTTTKVATGIKIVQRNTAGKIVHVYYLVLFGDVTGSGDVGDGLINATDSMEVLKEINREEAYLGAITKLAADVDHNNSITQNDADIILGYVVGNTTINQNSTITEAVDETCYFQTAVAF